MAVTELNDETFEEEVIKSKLPVIVDFFADWCGPCQMMKPEFEALSEEYEGKLKFAKINTDQHNEIAEKHKISGIPCLIVFKNGKEADRIVGFSPREALKRQIDCILK